jgi:hypothetical protein
VKDIQAAILQKAPEWAQDPDLVGWVRDTGRPTVEVMNELARLSLENNNLRAQVASLSGNYDGLSFEQLVVALRETQFDRPPEAALSALLEYCRGGVKRILSEVIEAKPRNAGELFEGLQELLAAGFSVPIRTASSPHISAEEVLRGLSAHGLITSDRVEPRLASRHVQKDPYMDDETLFYDPGSATWKLTEMGRRFRNRLLSVGDREQRRRLWSSEPDADIGHGTSA